MSAVSEPKSILSFMKVTNLGAQQAKIRKKLEVSFAPVVCARAMNYKITKTEKGERAPIKVNAPIKEPVERSVANSPEPPKKATN